MENGAFIFYQSTGHVHIIFSISFSIFADLLHRCDIVFVRCSGCSTLFAACASSAFGDSLCSSVGEQQTHLSALKTDGFIL